MTDSDSANKRSIARLRKLEPMLAERLDACAPALELLVAEAEAGEARPELWERLHAAADRDDRLIELGTAYEQLARGRRLRLVSPEAQVTILMHGADFLTGILGDVDGAAGFLERVIAADAEHADALSRLEKHLGQTGDELRLATAYAVVVAGRREPPLLLLGKTLSIIDRLPADKVLAFDVAEHLARAAADNPRVAVVLETHFKKAGHFKEAAQITELALELTAFTSLADEAHARHRLVDLYFGELKSPEAAIVHVEELLRAVPADADARKAAEKLLTVPAVATRASAALQLARGRGLPTESNRGH
jgi:tetratricopeptide (TPR) repeat protein